MRDKLMKHLDKKGKKLDPIDQQAKMGVVKELGRQAKEMLSSKVHPLKQVSVAADSKEGLKEGLDKAAGLVDHGDLDHETDPTKMVEGAEEELHADLDHDGEEGEPAAHVAKVLGHHSEMDASPEDEEHAAMSPDEIDAKIAKLHAVRAKKLSQA